MSDNQAPITKPSEALKLLATFIKKGVPASKYRPIRAGYHVCWDLDDMHDENLISMECLNVCCRHVKNIITMDGRDQTIVTYMGYLLHTNRKLWEELQDYSERFYTHKHAWVLEMALHFESLGQ